MLFPTNLNLTSWRVCKFTAAKLISNVWDLRISRQRWSWFAYSVKWRSVDIQLPTFSNSLLSRGTE
jgi:hypothetical protein